MVEAMIGAELTFFADQIGLCEGDELDEYSARQMIFGEDASQPAPRRSGDVEAITAAIESGLLFSGEIPDDVPMLDARHYLEDQLDMHNAHQSFVVRERIRRAGGNARQPRDLVPRRPPRGGRRGHLRAVHRGLRAHGRVGAGHPGRQRRAARACRRHLLRAPTAPRSPAARTSGTGPWSWCSAAQGDWTDEAPAEVDGRARSATARRPSRCTRRRGSIAGGPITADVYKCELQPVDRRGRREASTASGSRPTTRSSSSRPSSPTGCATSPSWVSVIPAPSRRPAREATSDADGAAEADSSGDDSDGGAALYAVLGAFVVAVVVGLSMLGADSSSGSDGRRRPPLSLRVPVAAVLAILSAFVYGAGDFAGGLVSRRLPAVAVVWRTAMIGLAGLLVLAAARTRRRGPPGRPRRRCPRRAGGRRRHPPAVPGAGGTAP